MSTVTDEITEITALDAEKMSGVASPANGTEWLLLKAADTEDCDTCKGTGKILQGNRKCPDCSGTGNASKDRLEKKGAPVAAGHPGGKPGGHSETQVAPVKPAPKKKEQKEKKEEHKEDEPPPQLTKSDGQEADTQEELLTGDAAKEWENVYCGDEHCQVCVTKDEQGTRLNPAIKALSDSDRKEMPAAAFAYIDKNGGRHLPIHDKGHIKSALGRHSQQDFSEAKGDPADAKQKAAAKIVAAAKKNGIRVDDKSAVAKAAAKCVGPGVGEHALAEPKVAGRTDLSKSGVAGSLTTPGAPPSNATLSLGGQSTYQIPLEDKVQNNGAIPTTTDGAGIVASMAKTVQDLTTLLADRNVVKEGKILTLTPPQGDAALTPGSPPWESYDAATLAQVAECLAGCCTLLDQIAARERTEGATVDPGDQCNAWDLEEAEQALDYALGVVARLSFHEAAEGGVAKAGRVLSGKNEQALRDARDQLQAVIDGAQGKPADGADSTEEQDIMATITKDELGEAITSGVLAGFQAHEQARKEAKKKQRKAEKAKVKEQAEKDQVNPVTQGGEIDEADIKANGRTDANTPQNAVPGAGTVDPNYVNKSEDDTVLTELQKAVAEQGELLKKIAKRPRPGGPMLGGQAPAAGANQQDLAKEQGATDYTRLEKSLQDAFATGDPRLIEQAGEALTKARLVAVNVARGFPNS